MEVLRNNYVPGDPNLIDRIVYELKSQGIFDQFRKECIADVDTKPAYQNLRQRVEGSVSGFLRKQTWKPDMNKNQVREMLRKSIHESGFLETGVERIVDQVVNPKINTVFLPQVEDVVYRFFGIEKPQRTTTETRRDLNSPLKINIMENLLPTDLEAISPDSDLHDDEFDTSSLNNENEKITKEIAIASNENTQDDLNDSKMDEDESPPFEPLEETVTLMMPEENSVDSHMSGFSGMVSHDSNQSQKIDADSQMSKHSSEERMSISDGETKMEVCDDSKSSNKFEFNQDSQSNSDKSSVSNEKKVDNEKRERKSSSSRHRSSSGRKEEREKRSGGDGKEKREKHSSSANKSGGKEKKDEKSSKHESRSEKDKSKSKSRHSSSSRDKNSSKKERTSDSNKDKSSKSLSSKDLKPKDTNKTHSSSSKHSSDKHKKDDNAKKHSSSSHHKDKRDSKKKDTKDDHFSSKQKKHDRRSKDRDSSDGQSSQKTTSNPPSTPTASAQTPQKQNQESSGSNDSNTSETDAVEQFKPTVEEAQRIKIIKPKFASNIHEARRLMKIRKQLDKIEKGLDLASDNSLLVVKSMKSGGNGLVEAMNLESFGGVKKVQVEDEKDDVSSKSAKTVEEVEKKSEKVVDSEGKPKLDATIVDEKNSKVEEVASLKEKPNKSKVHASKVEEVAFSKAKPNKSKDDSSINEQVVSLKERPNKSKDDASTMEEKAPLKEDSNRSIIGKEKPNKSKDEASIVEEVTPNKSNIEEIAPPKAKPKNTPIFEQIISPKTQRFLDYAIVEMERLQQSIESTITSSANTKKSKNLLTPVPIEETSSSPKTTKNNLKRKRNSDIKNNNKRLNNRNNADVVDGNVDTGMAKKTRRSSAMVTVLNDNFSLPLSPAESEKSVERKVEINEKMKRHSLTPKANQRYSSEDLYKPRLFFSSSRRRKRNAQVE